MEYKQLVYNEDQILNLYLENKWFAYTNNKKRLFKGIKNSLDCIGAYDNGDLVGLIRTVGDAETIVYILDILLLDSYKRKGFGRKLMNIILEKYSDVRQILLTTDNQDSTKKFYESLGFEKYEEQNIIGYYYKK